jgi:hypothetical protein
MENLNYILNELLKAVIVVGVPIALSLATAAYGWVKDWVKSHTTNQYLLRIGHEAAQIVAAMGQSMAGPMKDAAADGKLTEAEMQRVKGAALDALRSRLAGLPAELITDVKLGQAIEAAVGNTKLPAASVVPPVAPVSR